MPTPASDSHADRPLPSRRGQLASQYPVHDQDDEAPRRQDDLGGEEENVAEVQA